ncbi:hypothetical protein QVD17_14867 [Tagetes erecta]|uniref:Uncharacterized protein n=1 Tax=Tagetes erecta TaxID=13708 RepID=A0AAD8NY73_TARER|nr:hypothetical protein QVD17_14867 [Tagetes erecta]
MSHCHTINFFSSTFYPFNTHTHLSPLLQAQNHNLLLEKISFYFNYILSISPLSLIFYKSHKASTNISLLKS